MGTITGFTKREGEDVSSSETLITIDDAEINADMAALEAGLAEIASNKIELEKNLALAETGKIGRRGPARSCIFHLSENKNFISI